MTIYFTRRILQSIFTLLVISMILYGLISSVPGGFMSVYIERADYTPEDIARVGGAYVFADAAHRGHVGSADEGDVFGL